MPARRPDTSHAVALTDVNTRARFGIEGHSVRAPAVLVKTRAGMTREVVARLDHKE
jgi:hypothetical protein